MSPSENAALELFTRHFGKNRTDPRSGAHQKVLTCVLPVDIPFDRPQIESGSNRIDLFPRAIEQSISSNFTLTSPLRSACWSWPYTRAPAER